MKITIQYEDGLPFAAHVIARGDAEAWRALFEDVASRRTGFAGSPGDSRAREFAENLTAAIRAAEMHLESGSGSAAARYTEAATPGVGRNPESVPRGKAGKPLLAWLKRVFGAASNPIRHAAKLARGDYGLGRTYWGYGWGLMIAVGAITLAMSATHDDDMLVLAGVVLFLHAIYAVLVWVGIWNAAKRHSGRRLWRFLARVSIPILALTLTALTALVIWVMEA